MHGYGVVAPHAGAWIEMPSMQETVLATQTVAPHAGAWIEIGRRLRRFCKSQSLPMRERGLKFYRCFSIEWIEESLPMRERGLKFENRLDGLEDCGGRSPCGSVD